MKAVSILVSVLLGLMVLACAGEVPVSTVVDDTAPLVTSCLPAPAAVGQPRNVRLSITFDEALDSASVGTNSILLQPVSGGTAVRPSSVVLSADKKNVRVYLAGELAASTQYEVRLSQDIRNLAGLALGDHSWRFTTGTQLTKYALDLAVTAPAEGTLVRSSLTLAGTLGPVAELASLQYAVNTTNGMLSWRPIEVDPAQAGAWSYKLYTWEESFVEGTNTVYLRAVNISNETSMARVAIRVDNTMPTVRLDWPPSNTTISGTVQLRGSVLDAGGIAEVAYRIGADDTWHSVTPTGTNWTVLVDTRTYPDSMRSVTVRAIDTARNTNMVSAVASQVLVDNWSTSQSPWTDILVGDYCNSLTFGLCVQSSSSYRLAYGKGSERQPVVKYENQSETFLATSYAMDYRRNVDYIDYGSDPASGRHEIAYKTGWFTNRSILAGPEGSVAPKGYLNTVILGQRRSVRNDLQGIGVASMVTNGRYTLGVQFSWLNTRNNINGMDDELGDDYGLSPSVDLSGLEDGFQLAAIVYYNNTRDQILLKRVKAITTNPTSYLVTFKSVVASLPSELEQAHYVGWGQTYQTGIQVDQVNPNNVYVVYHANVPASKQVWLARSTDGGVTWKQTLVSSDSSASGLDIRVVGSVPYISFVADGVVFVAKVVGDSVLTRIAGQVNNPAYETTRLRIVDGVVYLAFVERNHANDRFLYLRRSSGL